MAVKEIMKKLDENGLQFIDKDFPPEESSIWAKGRANHQQLNDNVVQFKRV